MVRLSALNDPQRFASVLFFTLVLHLMLLFLFDMPGKFRIKELLIHKVQIAIEPVPTQETIPKMLSSELDDVKISNMPFLQQHQTISKAISKPANRRTISSTAHEERDKSYLGNWQSYIEHFGNNHYPEIAIKNNLKGDLRLLVAINKDGTIHEVKIRRSSGSKMLDQAAIKLVYQAGPFEPLPPEIAQDTEILEIIRTWQFRGKLTTS
ncbi:MAG: energy transducer TonB [Proteobacteria bacterium]|nr:energy transducer TonB [Pseudomonadota bacterium]